MSHLLTDMPAVRATDAAAAMAERIDEVRRSQSSPAGITRLAVRIEEHTSLNFLHWLATVETGPFADAGRYYWSDRRRLRETAAVGSADTMIANHHKELPRLFAELERRLHGQPDTVRYLGGFRFDPQCRNAGADSHWHAFPVAQFVLPRFELVRYGESLLFACNVTEQDWQDARLQKIRDSLANLPFGELRRPRQSPAPVDRHDQPDYSNWQAMMASVRALFDTGELRKVVLARQTSLTFDHPLSPWGLLDQLRTGSDGCFLFGVQNESGAAFVGSSPERLYSRDGLRLRTEAVAGTRPRGDSPTEDTALAEDLRSSEKDTREHRFVLDGITGALAALGIQHKQESAPEVRSLNGVHHLWCTIIGKLSEAITDQDLLTALHPTPAVGGVPTESATACIGALEPFDRGWYAGPIGWIGSTAAEFAVGIRSALIVANTAHLYAGAGIVPGSDPENEWRELETKIRRFVSVFAESE